jgi:flagellar basal body-associated protein FliL
MKKLLFLMMIAAAVTLGGAMCASPIFGQEKEPFEGNIRAATYNNTAETVSAAANKSSGGGIAELIGRKIGRKVAMSKASAVLNEIDGYSEVLMKIKGNKVAIMDVKNGAMLLADGDRQEVYAIYPSIKSGITYTFQEYAEQVVGTPKSIEQFPDSIVKVLDYECKKEIITLFRSMVISGNSYAFTNISQSWYTEQITLPPAYFILTPGAGLSMYSMNGSENLKDAIATTEVTEIEAAAVSDDAFTIPSDCEIVDTQTLGKRMLKIGKNKKNKKQSTYTVGGKIPDTFWDF